MQTYDFHLQSVLFMPRVSKFKSPVVAVAVYTDGYVKLHSVVGVVWLSLPQIPHNARASKHHSTESQTMNL